MSQLQKPGMSEPLLHAAGGSHRARSPAARAPTSRQLNSNRSVSGQSAFGFLDESEKDLFTTRFSIEDASVLRLVPENSCGYKAAKAAVGIPLTLVPVIGWAYGCAKVKLVPQGHLGLVLNSGRPVRLHSSHSRPDSCVW
jgi:hypothetical protein